jgi:hypothetical protein
MDGVAQDGSRVTFIQDERALITDAGVEITFGKTDRLVMEGELQEPEK